MSARVQGDRGPSPSEWTGRSVKPGYRRVLDSLAAVNIARGEAACVADVVEALTDADRTVLQAAYVGSTNEIVGRILVHLRKEGVIFSPGQEGSFRFYGVEPYLDPAAPLPDRKSLRQRVLELVREAVDRCGRPVRTADVVDYLEFLRERGDDRSGLQELDSERVVGAMRSLAQTGELQKVGTIRNDNRGRNLFLPSDVDPREVGEVPPLTFLEEVASVFRTAWEEEVARARAEERRPRPISTTELRTRAEAMLPSDSKLHGAAIHLINAVRQLARSDRPLVRAVRREDLRWLCWAPADVPDEDLDVGGLYLRDAERIFEAVRRAEEQLGRPVHLGDVRDQFTLEPSLRPASTAYLSGLVGDLTKPARIAQSSPSMRCVHSLGKAAGKAYFTVGDPERGRAYVEFLRLEARLEHARFSERASEAQACSLAGVALGRLLLVEREAAELVLDLTRAIDRGSLDGGTRGAAADLREQARDAQKQAARAASRLRVGAVEVPEEVDASVPAWTAEKLQKLLARWYPKARKARTPGVFAAGLHHCLRRVPNPDYVSRRTGQSRTASEFLFDRADALLHTSQRWGGAECRLQASLAGDELGLLRDARFVLPALDAARSELRLVAVACLAFLQPEWGEEVLRATATTDRDPGVRMTALWAYGFVGGTEPDDLLRERLGQDPSPLVQRFAAQALEAGPEWWWVM